MQYILLKMMWLLYDCGRQWINEIVFCICKVPPTSLQFFYKRLLAINKSPLKQSCLCHCCRINKLASCQTKPSVDALPNLYLYFYYSILWEIITLKSGRWAFCPLWGRWRDDCHLNTLHYLICITIIREQKHHIILFRFANGIMNRPLHNTVFLL